MRLLKFSSRQTEPEDLLTKRVLLRRPTAEDFEAWAALREASAEFLKPYEPRWTSDELSRGSFRQRLRHHEADIASGRGLPWFLFGLEHDGALLGGLTLSNVRRGVAQSGTLGYWMGEKFAGQGYMREAVEAVCHSAFQRHDLHRVEAATVTDNVVSQRLLERCGFQREGVARSYLKINGQWRDHILFARVNDSA